MPLHSITVPSLRTSLSCSFCFAKQAALSREGRELVAGSYVVAWLVFARTRMMANIIAAIGITVSATLAQPK
jgi:hypothetical protein